MSHFMGFSSVSRDEKWHVMAGRTNAHVINWTVVTEMESGERVIVPSMVIQIRFVNHPLTTHKQLLRHANPHFHPLCLNTQPPPLLLDNFRDHSVKRSVPCNKPGCFARRLISYSAGGPRFPHTPSFSSAGCFDDTLESRSWSPASLLHPCGQYTTLLSSDL